MPSVRTVEKLTKALGCRVSELIEPAAPGPHPHTDRIVVELVQAIENGEKSASEAIEVLVGLGVVERVPKEATIGGAV
jgi:hypothetical protein